MIQNYLQSISFYDLLTKITCGFLLELPLVVMSWEVITQSNFIIFLLLLFSYPLGLALESVNRYMVGVTVLFCLVTLWCSGQGILILLGLFFFLIGIIAFVGCVCCRKNGNDFNLICCFQRRCPKQIERAYNKVFNGENYIYESHRIQEKYDETWYSIYPKEEALSKINIMEAQLAFMKVAIIPLLLLLSFCLSDNNILFCDYSPVLEIFNGIIKFSLRQYMIIILLFTIISYVINIPQKQDKIYEDIFTLQKYSKNG